MQTLHMFAQAILPSAGDVLRVALWLLLLTMLFVPLERLAGLRPARIFRPEIGNDIAYFAINSLVPKMLLIIPVSLLAWAAHAVVPERILAFSGGLNFWVRFPLAMLVGEIGFYWGHRWSHEIPAIWRFHAVHHSAEHVDWLVNSRAHPIDMVFGRLCGFVPMYILGLAQVPSGRVDPVPLLVIVFGTVWGFFIHANLKWRLGWFEHLIATPAFHHWHHTNDEFRDHNYASTLPWLDRLFGTYHMPARQWPPNYGIDAKMTPGLIGQLLNPLRPEPSATQPASEGRQQSA